MPLKGQVLKDGATAMTPTGGTDMTFTSSPVTVAGGIALQNAAQTDFRIRENMQIRQSVPKVLADGTFTRDSKSVTYAEPKLLVSGSVTINFIRIERCIHPESTAAEAKNLNMMGGQILSDADWDSFWAGGSMD